jgi:hypothetical protein
MNLVKLQQTLMAAARARFRADGAEDRVPLAFEKRITALITARVVTDRWAQWSQGLWRCARPCAVLSVICGAWFLFHLKHPVGGDLSQDFDTTLLAAVDPSDLPQ